MNARLVTRTGTPTLRPFRTGKVRDLYGAGDRLVIVATDRLSAFDVILPDGIPGKGRVLTGISAYWFRKLAHIVPHHLLSVDLRDLPGDFRAHPEQFEGRSMLVERTEPFPVECVVRGYLAGSGWSDYRRTGGVCGIPLPPGLKESDRLPDPIFTPATKAPDGAHDENISFDAMVRVVGAEAAEELRSITLRLYAEGAAHAEARGIIIADTKFEFGRAPHGGIVWIDEAMTPDSSRFWPRDAYRPGGAQPSFDKQYVRDHLLAIGWDRRPPGPHLPPEVIATTSRKYHEALRLITGVA